ncbi:MAG: FtsX-like permease family protein [Coprococcus sp.]|nr:FtsX-like permease family protein [Coprococcus sp.]
MNIFSKITAKTMRQNRTRTIVTIIGVILSTSMITAVATFGTSFQKFMVDYSMNLSGNWHVGTSGLDADQAETLMENEEIEHVGEVKTMGYAWFDAAAEGTPGRPYLYVRALSKEALTMLPARMSQGRMPEKEDEIAVPLMLLAGETEENKTKVGDILTLELGERSYQGVRLTQDNEYMGEKYTDDETFTPRETRTYKVVGIYLSWSDVSFWGPGYDVLAGPTDADTKYKDLFIELKNPRGVYRFAKENLGFCSTLFYNESLLRWMGIADNRNLYTVMLRIMMILIVVIMAGSITLIYNAFSISLRERTAQFGLLSSIGATKKQLRQAMRYEAFFVSLSGIPLGILAGIVGTGVTLHYISGNLTSWIQGTKEGIPLYVPVWAIGAAALTAFVTVMISVWLPSRRIRRITPIDAIRSSTDIRVRPKEVKTGKWTLAIFGLEGMMAQKNYKRDRKKYRSTVISLTMSIVLFTAAGLFNLYLVKTGAFVLDPPEADLEYVLYDDVRGNEERVKRMIEETKDAVLLSENYSTSFTLFVPKEWTKEGILGYYAQAYEEEENSKDVPVDTVLIVLTDDDFRQFAKEQKVDISRYQDTEHVRAMYLNTAKNYNVDTQRYEKQTIFEETPEGMFRAGTVQYNEDGFATGMKKEMELELGDAVLSLPSALSGRQERVLLFLPSSMYEKFRDDFDEERLQAVYRLQCEDAGETYRQMVTRMEKEGLEGKGYLQNYREEYETDRNTLVAVKVLTYGFIVLISLIAVANIFNTISTNLMLRRKEFAMLRSMGMSPKGFRKMMHYECLIYGVRSLVYGVIFTILISAAISWSIGAGADVEFLVPWGYLAAGALGVFLVVFLTMLYTMQVIKRNNIVEELKMN